MNLYPKSERHSRSLTKSIVWRVIGVLFLALITYIFTRNWITTTLVTVVHHGVFLFAYYAHDRFWLKTGLLKDSKFKPIARVLLYEIVLGNLVLGLITWLFTREVRVVTGITLTYILNKCWMYYAFDYIWRKIKWQTK